MKKCIYTLLLSFLALSAFAQDFQVPANYKFEAKEDYKPYEPQILQAIDWALNTPLNKDVDKRKEVYAFILAWLSGSPDVSVNINFDIAYVSKTNQDLLFPFVMGWARYSLENNYIKDDVLGNKAGIETAVKFYEDNKSVLKKDKGIEKYKELIEKNKLEEELKKKIEKE